MGVEQGPRDRRAVDPGGEQSLGESVGLRATPPERSGVGHQSRVQAVRECGIDLDTPHVEEVGEHHRGGLGLRVDEVVGAEPRVGQMVVDHQDVRCGLQTVAQDTETARGTAVDGHHEIGLAAHLRDGRDQVCARQRPHRFRHVRGRTERHLHGDTASLEREPRASPLPRVSASGLMWHSTVTVAPRRAVRRHRAGRRILPGRTGERHRRGATGPSEESGRAPVRYSSSSPASRSRGSL